MEETESIAGSQKESKLTRETKTQFDLKYARRTLVLFGLIVLTVFYVEIMLAPSIPQIRLDYNVTLGQTSLILALYTVFGVALTPVVGKLGDIYGKKKILSYVLIAYSVMVILTSFAPDFNTLLISRTFQGIGLAVMPLAFSLAREEFPRELIPRAQALISGMVFAGIGLGLSVGAFVSNFYGWQANYHIAAPIVIVLTILTIFAVRESTLTNIQARLDYVGSAILGSSLAMIVLGISQGSQWGWYSTPILGLLSVGTLLLVPLVLYERRIKEPLLNFAQLRVRNVSVANILAVTTGASMVLGFSSLSYKLEDVKPAGYGYDILTTGLYILPVALVMLIVSYPIGILNSRFGAKPFLIIGSVVGVIGSALLATETTAIEIPEYLIVVSLGFAMLLVSRQILLVLSIKPAEMASLTSINQVFFSVGQSLGPAISASILSTYSSIVVLGGHAYSFPTSEAFQYTFLFGAGIFIVSLLVAFLGKEVIRRKAKTFDGSISSGDSSPKIISSD